MLCTNLFVKCISMCTNGSVVKGKEKNKETVIQLYIIVPTKV